MAQKERELISERTRAALAAAKARGKALGGDRGYRPAKGPNAVKAAQARRQAAERAAHRLVLEIERLRIEGIEGHAALGRALNARCVPTPGRTGTWTHAAVSRVIQRAASALVAD
jgi:DNA invertase Pin-like site-specific DNA recombinase